MALAAFSVHAQGHVDSYPAFTSKYVAARGITVWTPEGYDPKGPPLPVLYMQDGQALFDAKGSLSGAAWDVGKTLTRLIADKSVPPVIVVGIDNTALRGREYLPQKVFDRLPAKTRARIEKNWQGAPLSDAYLKFMVDELKPFIDSHYDTKTDAADTFVAGSSMGGLIALYAQAEYPQVFGASASLSMHWPLDNPWVSTPDDATQAPQVLKAFESYLKASRLSPDHNRIYVDQGTETLDGHYRPYNRGFMSWMHAHGWQDGAAFSSEIFPGEAHTEGAWAKRLDVPLRFLLSRHVVASGTLIHYPQVTSAFVRPRDVVVWLPDAYDPKVAYPVVYMMDGQNLFEPSSYSGADWGVAEVLPRLAAARKVPEAVVVGVYSTVDRNPEYMPQKVYDRLAPDYQAKVRAFEEGKAPISDAYLKFLVTELKPMIDKTYHTIPGPEGTSIMGSSMGADIALYAQGEYPKVFGASASLSMPWVLGDLSKDPVVAATDARVIAAAWKSWFDQTGMRPGPNRVYSDQGTVELDGLFTPYEQAAVPMFAGWGKAFAAPIYPGARHSETDWRKRLDVPMTFVLNR
jgi:enterochelin esterase-like enzyme